MEACRTLKKRSVRAIGGGVPVNMGTFKGEEGRTLKKKRVKATGWGVGGGGMSDVGKFELEAWGTGERWGWGT